jgi:hypothetical protein
VAELADLRQVVTRLNETTATINATRLNATLLEETNATLRDLNNETATVRQLEQETLALLFENVRAGMTGQQETGSVAGAVQNREANASGALQAYYETLGEQQRAIATAIRTKFLLGLVGGLLIGAILGAVKPHRKGREVDHYRDYSSRETYDPSVLFLPLGAGVLMLLAAVGLLAFGDTGVLQVMLP